MSTFRFTTLFACLALLTGCNGTTAPDTGADAGADTAAPTDVVDVTADVPVDTGPPHVPATFGDCTADADCPTNEMCILNTQGWPGGFCTNACTRDADCNPEEPFITGVCGTALIGTTSTRMCLRECLNGFDCGRAGYTCIKNITAANPSPTNGVCQPSCTDASCGTGTRCNAYSGYCEATSVTYPPPGADDGAACNANADCRSAQCIPAQRSGAYSGWNGGTCISNCALPSGWNSTSLWPTDTFPQSNCPTNAICFPSTNDEAEDGPGQCIEGCMADTDCRASEGYYCHRTFGLIRLNPDHSTYTVPHTWNNGICEPIDCLNDTTEHCPSAYYCETQNRTASDGSTYQVGVCHPGASPDAGTPVDAASDSGPTDGGSAVLDASNG